MKYVLKETNEVCMIIETYTDLFGQEMVRVRTESGEEFSVLKNDISFFLQD
jgi:hypothetical protein